MRYLLDVNALIALGFDGHQFHGRVVRWHRENGFPPLLTCSITELGFIRIMAQVYAYDTTISEVKALLLELKRSPGFTMVFVPDTHDISHLPGWVRSPRQTTDGHLLALATANDAVLATFDERLAGAFLIP